MTFINVPWAIDGAEIPSSLARLATYAALGDTEGIVSKGDLKVTELAVPGVGVQVAKGAAIILNRYQNAGDINQHYAVANEGVYTVPSADMPPANASARSHLVCVTIGDPQFDQTGHPWMLATDPPVGQENTFDYVRVFIIPNVPGTAGRSYPKNNLGYPALAIARIDVPANTTTILNSYITDLRKLARPQAEEHVQHIPTIANDPLNGEGGVAGTWERFPDQSVVPVEVPDWAVKAKVSGFLEGLRLTKAGQCRLRVAIQENQTGTEPTNVNESAPTSGIDRRTYNVGGEIPIPESLRGTTVNFVVQGMPNDVASKGALTTDSASSVHVRVRLEEVAE